jgi:hypothetical protein
LDPAVLTVAQVGEDLQPAIRQAGLLHARASDGILCAWIEQHEAAAIFHVMDGGVLGQISAGIMSLATGEKGQSRCETGQSNKSLFHIF